jgi:hypothetical protein
MLTGGGDGGDGASMEPSRSPPLVNFAHFRKVNNSERADTMATRFEKLPSVPMKIGIQPQPFTRYSSSQASAATGSYARQFPPAQPALE